MGRIKILFLRFLAAAAARCERRRQRKKAIKTDFYSNCIRLGFPSQASLTQLQANIVEWGWSGESDSFTEEKIGGKGVVDANTGEQRKSGIVFTQILQFVNL
jgi:hypothetical protein